MYQTGGGSSKPDHDTFVKAFSIPPEMVGDFELFYESLPPQEREALCVLAAGMARKSGTHFIGSLPAEEILNSSELSIYESELEKGLVSRRSPSTRLVVVMKATRLCNLRCLYCRSWAEGPNQVMKFSILLRAIRDALAMRGLKEVEFVWHGGEVTMLKPKFFKKMIWLQEQLRQQDQIVTNSLQTNATQLDDEWITFLSSLDMGVGISIDGPPEIHDRRRLSVDGKPTSHLVAEGIERLRRANIPHGALVVADRDLVNIGAERVLDYFAEIGLEFIDFLNIVPSNDAAVSPSREQGFIRFDEYVQFLKECFDVWWAKYRDVLKIDTFEDLVPALTRNQQPSSCYWAGYCMNSVVTLEANGDLAPCDKYIGDAGSIYGNIMEFPFADLIRQSSYLQEAQKERVESFQTMKSCDWFQLCQGGCPHDRLVNRRHFGVDHPSCCGLAPLLTHMHRQLRHVSIAEPVESDVVGNSARPNDTSVSAQNSRR